MKSRIILSTIAFAALFLAGVTAQAQSMNDYRTKDAMATTWSTDSHWEIYNGSAWVAASFYPGESGGPTPLDVNIRHATSVDVTDAFATTLNVDAALTVDSAKLLTLGGEMDVDANITVNGSGKLDFIATGSGPSDIASPYALTLSDSGSTLRIAANHTIGGAGAIVGSDPDAKIEIGYSGGTTPAVFTNSATIKGQLLIVDVSSQVGSFTNTGVVNADADGTLLVNISGTLGDSLGDRWRSTAADAVLKFGNSLDDNTTSISLSGDFTISNVDAVIQIDEMADLTSPFTTIGQLNLSAGLFDLHEDVTMGQDAPASPQKHMSKTGGNIAVADGNTFIHN